MRTCVVVLPKALERENEVPLLPEKSRGVAKLFAHGQVCLVKTLDLARPEYDWVGLFPDAPSASRGVLAVAAFGADPPERSTHFCLNFLTTDADQVLQPTFVLDPSHADQLYQASLRLETKSLKLVRGVGLDHALVWENGSIEMECREPSETAILGLRQSLPVGDGETMIRRFIDDSMNVLSELEVNRARQDEGLDPLNLLWPWGPGFRPYLQNMVLKRGADVRVESPSPWLKGLCRLIGYKHGDPWNLGFGTNLRLETIADSLQNETFGLAVIPTIGEFRMKGRHEEAAWLGNEVIDRLIEPLLRSADQEPYRMLVIATGAEGLGLALDFQSHAQPTGNIVPFSAEALEEKSLPRMELHQLIAEALTA